MTRTVEYSVVYNSDYIISNPSHLTNLTIFYDKVFLPSDHTTGLAEFVYDRDAQIYRLRSIDTSNFPRINGRYITTEQLAKKWESEHQSLFQENVLARVETPPQSHIEKIKSNLSNGLSKEFSDFLFSLDFAVEEIVPGGSDRVYLWSSVLTHMLRTDIDLPSVFKTRSKHANREVKSMLIADEIFRYPLPKLDKLRPEELLELRRMTASNREGFLMYLRQLSADIDERLETGQSMQEVKTYARNIVETNLIPQYREFRRQLVAKRWGRLARLGKLIAKTMLISVGPNRLPSFLETIANTTAWEAERAALSSKNIIQAYQFMMKTEDYLRGR